MRLSKIFQLPKDVARQAWNRSVKANRIDAVFFIEAVQVVWEAAVYKALSAAYEDSARIAERVGVDINNGTIPPSSGSVTRVVAKRIRDARRARGIA